MESPIQEWKVCKVILPVDFKMAKAKITLISHK